MENKKPAERMLAHSLATVINCGELNQVAGGVASGTRKPSNKETFLGADHTYDSDPD